ncbi:MAG: tetratricopeptide repeat protein, partial [Nitrospiraceae bacterium]
APDLCRLDLPADREWESIRAEYHYCIPPAWQFRKLMREGNDYVRSGMYDEAERKYRDVLSAERMSRDHWAAAVLELGQLYLKMGDDDKAEGLFMEACCFQEVSPKSRSALMQAMAYIHLKKKDHGRAREAFNHAMEIDRAGENTEGGTAPGGGKEACRSSAYCNGDAAGETGRLNKQGEDLFARGDIEGALSCFKKALAIDPDDTTANNNMGVVCMQTGMFRESTARFLRVLKKDPYNRDTTINCAELLKSTGDVASAIRLYQAYITVYPDDEEIRQLMTDIMDMKENKDLNIIYVPAFDTAESLADQYYRMLWYMHPVAESIRHIHIPLSLDNITELKLPGYLDPEIVKLESRFKGKITFFPDNEPYLWSRYLEDADIVMKWKLDFTHDDDGIDRLVRDRIEKKKSWDIDREKVQQDGLMYLRMSHDANRNRTADLQESREKFGDFMKRVEHARKGYIFGTGPSLDEAMNHDFSDGVTIACNSMVKNERLMEHLNPEAVVFGDPIFHAGCSRYAGEFRKHLYRLLDKYNAHIIVPFRDYKLYSENMPPKYRGRLIGIPTGGYDEPLNLNLNDMFIVKPTKNILTLLMIPVACTAFEEIGIMGCDGRKIEDNRYFWAHHKESQFNEQMEGIKKAHPAFFAIDYNDYYITHCEILETWLAEAERAGKTILNLTESYIPALQKRSASTVGTPWSGQSAGQENSTEQ